MPIYEYQCGACGHHLEALQKINDAPLKKCPDCGKSRLKRLLSAPMFLLKGSGWYETDFKSDKERKKNLADRPDKEEKKEEKAPAKADSPAADSAKADAKTESRPDSAKPQPVKASRSARKTHPRRPKGKRR